MKWVEGTMERSSWPPPGEGRALNMLLTSAGRRVGLLRAFEAAARRIGVKLTIHACDVRPEWSAACQLAAQAFAVPPASSPDYAEAIRAICIDHGIGLVVPTIDTELEALSELRAGLAADGVHIAVSDPSVIAIARDKLLTAEALQRLGIRSPRTESIAEARAAPHSWDWPVIVKPRHGSAGRLVRLAHGCEELELDAPEPMIVQELVRGEEWTVNLYVNGAGTLEAVIPHKRVAIRAGEVEKGVTQRVPALEEIGQRIVAGLPGARGVLCYQAIIREDDTPSVFEINARFGGGYPLADRAGASFAQWLIEECLELPSTAGNDWASGVTMLRFDDAVFL